MSKKLLKLASLVAILTLVFVSGAFAAPVDDEWQGGNGTDWTTGGNWTGSTGPSDSGTLTFNEATNDVVTAVPTGAISIDFTSLATSQKTLTLDDDAELTVGKITFAAAAVGGLIIDGSGSGVPADKLIFTDDAEIATAAATSLTLGANLTALEGGKLAKTGTGVLNLASTPAWTVPLSITGTAAATDGVTTAIALLPEVSVDQGATLTLTVPAEVTKLTGDGAVAGGANVLTLGDGTAFTGGITTTAGVVISKDATADLTGATLTNATSITVSTDATLKIKMDALPATTTVNGTLDAANDSNFTGTLTFIGVGSHLKINVAAANLNTVTPALTLATALNAGETSIDIAGLANTLVVGDYYTVLSVTGANALSRDVVVPDATYKVSADVASNLLQIVKNSVAVEGDIEFGDLTTTIATPGTQYIASVDVTLSAGVSAYDDYDITSTDLDWLGVEPVENDNIDTFTFTFSGDVPAGFNSGTLTLTVSNDASNPDFLPAVGFKTFTITSKDTTPTPPTPPTSDVKVTLSPSSAVAGSANSISGTIEYTVADASFDVTVLDVTGWATTEVYVLSTDAKPFTVGGTSALTVVGTYTVRAVLQDDSTVSGDATFTVTDPGGTGDPNDLKVYLYEPKSIGNGIQVKALVTNKGVPLPNYTVELTATPVPATTSIRAGNPATAKTDKDGIAIVRITNLKPGTAYTIGVTGLKDADGNAVSTTLYDVTRSDNFYPADGSGFKAGKSSSGGGCDAGFAALSLLLAAPLFLRRKKA
ncbi:hypothetical protein FACS1894187_08400 [Synergistales bacterium]|nr:hypothetical protein FACS1894187_08400 [Synergistales bacterium]